MSKGTVLFIDHGLFIGVTKPWVRAGHPVLYSTSWKNSFPSSNVHDIGAGYDGVEVVDDVWSVILKDYEQWMDPGAKDEDGYLKEPSVSLIVVPDLYLSPEVTTLRGLGYRVWGAGLSNSLKESGEDIEIDRIKWKKKLESLGLPFAPYHVCRGDEELEAYVKLHRGRHYIKGSKCRADFESQECTGIRYIQSWLRDVRDILGERAATYEFIVENAVEEAVEAAWDTLNVYGEFPNAGYLGLEAKCLAYCGVFSSKVPPALRAAYDALAPFLEKTNYCQFFSIETLFNEAGVGFASDVCARAGLPCGASQMEGYANTTEIMMEGAAGILVQPKPKWACTAELVLQSHSHKRQTVPVPKDLEDCTYLVNAWKVRGAYEVMPAPRIRPPNGLAVLGTVVCGGSTMRKAMDACAEAGKELASLSADLEVTPGAFKDIEENFEKMAERGAAMES